MANNVVLVADKVVYSYGNRPPACDDISLQVRGGELVALLGPNGAGKSTFLTLLAGLKTPRSGSIKIQGEDPRFSSSRKQLAMTPQESSFPKTVKAREILDFVAAQYEIELEDELLEALNLGPLMEKLMGALSGGERRRVGLACALGSKAPLIILDEPTSGLDLESRYALFDYLKRAARQKGQAILFSTHHMEEVEQIADRVIVLRNGRILREGHVDQLKDEFGFRRVRFRAHTEVEFPPMWSAWTKNGVHEVVAHEPEKFVRWLVESKVDFFSLEVERVSLDDIFINLMGLK